MLEIKRSDENPILIPDSGNFWEAEATFNGCPVRHGKNIKLLYRAVSRPQQVDGAHFELSTIGIASSSDGAHFKNRRQFIKPEYDWEKFGCEDPRVTKLGGKYYIFYTALSQYPFNADGIKIGLAITKDFKKTEKHPVTPFNAKAMALFPEKINGKLAAVLTADTDRPPAKIAVAFFDKESDIWSPAYWEKWYKNLPDHALPLSQVDADQVEVGAPPVKTNLGWLFLYSFIKNYRNPPATFDISVSLLDLKNPKDVVVRLEKSLMVPQEEYERYGRVPNIIFPSGALLKDGKLLIYYGATDTTCALATVNLRKLLRGLCVERERSIKLTRYEKNPILEPLPQSPWQSKAVFNAGAIYLGGKVHILYRAMSENGTSVIGYASSSDGFKIEERLSAPIYKPRKGFEKKGTEDPRLTKIGDKIYMCYTAWSGTGPARIALTSISEKDFLAKRWSWAEPVLISPPDVDDKDAAIFPKKVKGRFAILHRIGKSIWLDYVDDLAKFDGRNVWLKGKAIMDPRLGERDSQKIGIAGMPIETEKGWLLLYHGISKKPDNHYHLRAALLDLKDPSKIIARTSDTVLEPEASYEKADRGIVFSNGAVIIGNRLFVYYGGADKVLGVATIKLSKLFDKFTADVLSSTA